jgi:hypothetical protein
MSQRNSVSACHVLQLLITFIGFWEKKKQKLERESTYKIFHSRCCAS